MSESVRLTENRKLVDDDGVTLSSTILSDSALLGAVYSVDGRVGAVDLSATYAPVLDPRAKDVGKLGKFFAALAQVGTVPVDVLVFGDSLVEGAKATNTSQRWINQFLNRLRTAHNPTGVVGGFGYVPAATPTPADVVLPWTLGGAMAANTSSSTPGGAFGLNKRMVTTGSAGTATLAVGPATTWGAVTGIDIIYTAGPAAGSFTVTVDGGAPATVNANATLASARYQIRSLDPTIAHTVVVTWVSGSVWIEGAMLYNGDESAGVRMWDGGHYGSQISIFGTYADNSWLAAVAIDPDLVVFAPGLNDWDGIAGLAAFQSRMTTAIANIKIACPNASILVIGQYERYESGGVNAAGETWAQYLAATKAIVDADGTLGYFDMNARVGSAISSDHLTPYGLWSDTVHPNSKGHAFYGQAIARFLDSEGVSAVVYQQGGTDVAVADGGTGASTAAAARTNLGAAPLASPTFTGTTTAPEFSASGLTGAVSASRYVGATASGAPVSGTFAVGDFVITQVGSIFICTVAGTPGTWQLAGANWTPLPIYKTADETVNNSAAAQDDDHLFFAIGANEIWVAEYMLFVATVSATPSIDVDLTVPSGATMNLAAVGPRPTNNDAIWLSPTVATASGTKVRVGSSNGTRPYMLFAYVANGETPGSVKLQWCQGTATAENTVFKTGSYVTPRRIA